MEPENESSNESIAESIAEVKPSQTGQTTRAGGETRATNAKGHKSSCVCTLCRRIQARIARGELSQAEVREQRKQQREQKQREQREQREQQKQRTTLLSRKRQEREAQQTALEASIETQARLGHKPNVALAGEIVGMDPRRAQQISQAEGFVSGALSRAGITDAKLAEVAAEGIDAMIQRIVTDRDGNISDVVNIPDWRSRHLFWSDLLKVKKILGSDAETGGSFGGLIVIAPENAKVLPGHPPACVCDQCRVAWEDKAAHLRKAAIRDAAIRDAEIARAQLTDPRAQNAVDAEFVVEEEDVPETDDFGALVDDEPQPVTAAPVTESRKSQSKSRDGKRDGKYGPGKDDFDLEPFR